MQGHPAGVSLGAGRRRAHGLTGLALAVLLGGCATSFPKERGERLEQRVDRIEGESPARQLEQEGAAIREQTRRMDALIAEVQAKLKELDGAARSGGAERSARQRELAEELGRLRATVEQLARRLDAMEKGLAEAPRRRGGERVARPSPEVAPEKPAPRVTPETGAIPKDKAGYLAFARDQERQGRNAVARELYESYATQYPTDPTAAEARFRLGELAFAERRYRDAILEYGKVARDFPRSDKAPDALLRTAESMSALKLHDEATAVLSEIPQRYPGSPAAARASKRLSEMPKASGTASQKSD